MELLKQYASVVGFEYETIEYETYSKALNAVYSGEADKLLEGYQILMYWGVVFTGNSSEKYSV